MKNRLLSLTQWKCKHGHVMGGVEERVRMDGPMGPYHVDRLLLFRHAIDLQSDSPADVDVVGPVIGDAGPFRCDICGKTRTWESGEVGLQRMVDIALSRRKVQLSTDSVTDSRIRTDGGAA